MDLSKELEQISQYAGKDTEAFKKHYKYLVRKYHSEEEVKKINDYVETAIAREMTKTGEKITRLNIKVQLEDCAELLPLSYIAKKYFNKTSSWLYQRINGNKVNGKPANFTKEEIKTFNKALKDISNKIGSLSIEY